MERCYEPGIETEFCSRCSSPPPSPVIIFILISILIFILIFKAH